MWTVFVQYVTLIEFSLKLMKGKLRWSPWNRCEIDLAPANYVDAKERDYNTIILFD